MPNSEFDNLIEQLHSLQGDALRGVERKALTEVGKEIQVALVAAAPIQTHTPAQGILEPGELKESIKPSVRIATDQKIQETGRGSYVVVRPIGKAKKMSAEEYSTIKGPYSVAGWLEDGHAGPTPESAATPPHPFVQETVEAIQDKVTELFKTTMETEIKAVMNV